MKITLEFDDDEAAENFISWWLDGGGEQYKGFHTEIFDLKSGYMRIVGRGIIDEEYDKD